MLCDGRDDGALGLSRQVHDQSLEIGCPRQDVVQLSRDKVHVDVRVHSAGGGKVKAQGSDQVASAVQNRPEWSEIMGEPVLGDDKLAPQYLRSVNMPGAADE